MTVERRAAYQARMLERFGRAHYTPSSASRWVEQTAREVEVAEASGGFFGRAPSSRWSLHSLALAIAIPRLAELEEIAGPIAECELARHRLERHTPEHHPLTDPDYFERDRARLPSGFAEGLTFEPPLPERTSWELRLGATAGYRRRLARRRPLPAPRRSWPRRGRSSGPGKKTANGTPGTLDSLRAGV